MERRLFTEIFLWSFSGKEFMERRKIEIGERLRREREKAGYSQEAFAEMCGYNQSLLVKETELSKGVRNKTIPYSEAAEIKTLTKTIATMKKTWMSLYEQYTDDKLSREDFLSKRRSTMKKQPDWRKG